MGPRYTQSWRKVESGVWKDEINDPNPLDIKTLGRVNFMKNVLLIMINVQRNNFEKDVRSASVVIFKFFKTPAPLK